VTPRITDPRSRQLPDSTIHGVVDSPYRWYAESATLWLNKTGSRRLTVPLVRGVDDSLYHWHREFLLKNSIADSPYWGCGESQTSRISDVRSWRLRVSVMRGVGDSPYHWCVDSATPRIGDSGESFFKYEYLREIEAKIGTPWKVV
jgi:hypothetical protein